MNATSASTKNCFACKETKPASEFYANAVIRDGLSSYCKECHKAHGRKKRQANPEHMKALNKVHYRNRKVKDPQLGRTNYLKQKAALNLNPTKARADAFIQNSYDKNRCERDVDVTRDFVADLLRNSEFCKCCGKKLRIELNEENQRGRQFMDAPSIDRVDNRIGYTRKNIAVVCYQCNVRKRDLTLEDLEMFASYIRNHFYVR